MKEDRTKTSIIIEAVKAVLSDTEVHTLGEIKAYIKDTYPDVVISNSTFNTIFTRQKNEIQNLQSLGKGRYQIMDTNATEERLAEYNIIDEYINTIESEFNNIHYRNKNTRYVEGTTEQEFIAVKAILESNKRLKKIFEEEKKRLEFAKEKIKILQEFDAKSSMISECSITKQTV